MLSGAATASPQVWVQQFGTNATESAYAATIDGSGGVFVGGSTNGQLGAANAGGYDAWLERRDGAGNRMWMIQFGTPGFDTLLAAASDGSGGAFVTGEAAGNLGGTYFGSLDAYVARYDASGAALWARQLGSSASDYPTGAASDGQGGVLISGATFGSLAGVGAGFRDAWLARYDASGSLGWVRQLGTNGTDIASAVASDPLGGAFRLRKHNRKLGRVQLRLRGRMDCAIQLVGN
ncbi:MAG: hypothetical protein IPK60_20655 [Sandaracinaceae bacterium]|nr:hypothetical protein [Sandaracinaceae bacterium]